MPWPTRSIDLPGKLSTSDIVTLHMDIELTRRVQLNMSTGKVAHACGEIFLENEAAPLTRRISFQDLRKKRARANRACI